MSEQTRLMPLKRVFIVIKALMPKMREKRIIMKKVTLTAEQKNEKAIDKKVTLTAEQKNEKAIDKKVTLTAEQKNEKAIDLAIAHNSIRANEIATLGKSALRQAVYVKDNTFHFDYVRNCKGNCSLAIQSRHTTHNIVIDGLQKIRKDTYFGLFLDNSKESAIDSVIGKVTIICYDGKIVRINSTVSALKIINKSINVGDILTLTKI